MSDEGYEMQYIQEAFDTNWIAPLGKNVDEFEKELAAKVGAKSAAALSSGTAAIHLALKAAGVGAGDIVFCQSLTFSATANPIIYQNAIPVFIDSDYKTWNMCPKALEQAFEKYTPRAVIVVHLYGLSADMDKIVEICKKHNVPLIEDAAESLGTYYKGKHTGTFGDYGLFSFNGNKIITTSGGGMLVSDNEERIAKVRFWATQSRDPARHYQHSELGFNYRMSNVVAGVGRGQLKVLEQRVEKKKYIFEFYKRELGQLDGIDFMPINGWNEPNYWLSCMTLSGYGRPLDIMKALEAENIESRPIWKPMHMQPFFVEYDFIGEGVSEELFENGVCLPSDTKMTDVDLKRVVQIVKGLWRYMHTEIRSSTKFVVQQHTKGGIYRRYIKRPMDIILSFIAIIVLSPVLLVVAFLVRVKLGSPVIFKHKRPGFNEKFFTMYKFRTMTDERDENGEFLPDSVRLTRLGKLLRSTSLDELPELYNILKGDMSIIGPRPLLVQYLSLYNEHQKRRHEVKPGLSGLAQVSGRNAISWEDKFNLDIEYADDISFINDWKIIFLTLKKAFVREGINSETAATMEYFEGSKVER